MSVPAAHLRQRGHDTVQVRERDGTMSDTDIITWAHAEGRVIITTDKDFGALAVRQGQPHSGMIRLPDVPRAVRLQLIARVLDEYGHDLRPGAVVTVTPTRVRIRHG